MVAAPDTLSRSGRRHRVAAIGSGFGGLTATKALKHAQVNITDALVFLARIVAQGMSHLAIPTPLWLQVIPAIAGLAGITGVVIALHLPATPLSGSSSSGTARRVQLAASVCRSHTVGTETTVTAPVQ
jgi:hypothetical protein